VWLPESAAAPGHRLQPHSCCGGRGRNVLHNVRLQPPELVDRVICALRHLQTASRIHATQGASKAACTSTWLPAVARRVRRANHMWSCQHRGRRRVHRAHLIASASPLAVHAQCDTLACGARSALGTLPVVAPTLHCTTSACHMHTHVELTSLVLLLYSKTQRIQNSSDGFRLLCRTTL
jgi:hypothetical protein